MNPSKKPGKPAMRVQIGSFQADQDEKEVFSISTARKSSIEARIVCAVCGVRANRDELESCPCCGSLLCPDCRRRMQKKGRL